MRQITLQLREWITQWPAWWRALPAREKVGPVLIVIVYLGILALLGGLRSDHYNLCGIFLALSYGGRPARVLLKFILPLILTAVIYDSQRFYSDYIRGPIHVEESYHFDKRFFGIRHEGQILTPNEWLQLHLHPVLDLITGLAYLIFIGVYVLGAAYITFWLSRTGTKKCSAQQIAEQAPRVMWSFFWVNIIGYSTYYWYAAAPPWYVALHGLGPADLSVSANPAGCIRFDQLLGTQFFTGMYGRSADVFGAIPSLHVAYPFLGIIYAFKFGSARIWNIFFYVLMCFAAVYLNHHYIIDLIWGTAYAILIAWLTDWWYERKARLRNA